METATDLVERFCWPTPTPPPRRRDQALLAEADPFEVTLDGRALAAYAWGDGPPVLLAHGWASRVAHLAAFVEPLVAAGLRPVAVEMPGHGPGPGASSNLLQFALALRTLGERTGPAAGVIAHSGGALATVAALDAGLRAARVVLLAPMVRLERSVERFAAAHDLDAQRTADFKAGMLARFSPGLWDAMAADLLASRLAGIPALLIHDPEDPQVPYDEAVLLARAWPGAELRAAGRVWHQRILRDRDTVAQAVAFLTSLTS